MRQQSLKRDPVKLTQSRQEVKFDYLFVQMTTEAFEKNFIDKVTLTETPQTPSHKKSLATQKSLNNPQQIQ